MLFLLTLLSSGKQALGTVSFRKGVKEFNKSYQHTSAAPSINKTFLSSGVNKPVKFNQPVYKYAALHGDKKALRDKHGEYTYSGLLASSQKFAEVISGAVNGKTEERVAFLCPNDASYIVTQWACWISGQTAVPLSRHFPPPLMEYFVNDCDAKVLITTPQYSKTMSQLAEKTKKQLVVLEDLFRIEAMAKKAENEDTIVDNRDNLSAKIDSKNHPSNDKAALILYTSGSTGPPKGVVLTHGNLQAQVSSQAEAWQWSPNDIILHSLPLHHIHGVVNALLTPFMVGAKCVMHSAFNPAEVWNEFLGRREGTSDRISVFMGVPTMYMNLLNEYDRSLTKK